MGNLAGRQYPSTCQFVPVYGGGTCMLGTLTIGVSDIILSMGGRGVEASKEPVLPRSPWEAHLSMRRFPLRRVQAC